MPRRVPKPCDDAQRWANCLNAVALAAGLLVGCGKSPPQYLDGVVYPEPTYKPGMTYYKDVLAITQTACQGCHVQGGVGPFPLSSYAEAQKNHVQMAAATQARRMPPWMPSDDCQSFKDARALSQDQIDTLYSWSKDNAPEGDPADAPPPPMGTGQTLVGPYSELDIGGEYTPVTTDDYRCFVLDPKLTADSDLTGHEFIAGVRAEVHHVLVYSGSLAELQAKDQAGAGLGYTCYGGPGIASPQLVAAWVPGSSATLYPSGTGIPIKAGAGLVMQIHYNTLNAKQPDRSKIRLQFAATRVPRPALLTSLAENTFRIPAGAVDYSASNSLTTPSNVTLWGVAPHLHQLGKRAKIEALPPGGNSQCLIDIPRWDFHWQQAYALQTPLTVHSSDTIQVECTYDNRQANQPVIDGVQQAPRDVTWGEGTLDEMCLSFLTVTAKQ